MGNLRLLCIVIFNNFWQNFQIQVNFGQSGPRLEVQTSDTLAESKLDNDNQNHVHMNHNF